MQSQRSVLYLLTGVILAAASGGLAATNWVEFSGGTVQNIVDVPPDVTGVRALNGTVQFRVGNTYSGGTEILGGICYLYESPPNPFGSGPVSIRGGRLQAMGDVTVANSVTIDGNFSFGCGNASYPDDDISFSQPVTLTGNRTLAAYDGDGTGDVDLKFLSGIGDGGNGYSLSLAREANADHSGGIQIYAGSTYSGSTIAHGSTIHLYGLLDSTADVLLNRGGAVLCYYTASGSNTKLGDTVPVYLRGGTLGIYGSEGGGVQWAVDETIGWAGLDFGHSTLSAGAKRARASLTLTEVERDAGSTAIFYRSGTSQAASYDTYGYGRIYMTGQTNGFVGGWALARRSEYISGIQEDSGYDFAWYLSGGGRLSGVLPLSLSGQARPGQVEGAAATNHVKAVSAQTALSGNAQIASLCVSGARTNDLGGYRLDITSGGLLSTSDYEISGGTLTSSGGAMYLYNLGGTMTVAAGIAGASYSVSTVGSMTLSGANSMKDLYVNRGKLVLSSANTFGSIAQVAPGATLSVEHPDALSASLSLSLLFDGEEHGVCNLSNDVAVADLLTNGVALAKGEYNNASLPDYLSGGGSISVLGPPGFLLIVK